MITYCLNSSHFTYTIFINRYYNEQKRGGTHITSHHPNYVCLVQSEPSDRHLRN